jgi:hypothetical protein
MSQGDLAILVQKQPGTTRQVNDGYLSPGPQWED